MRVAVIGSGFSALAAVQALLRRGVRPVVLDAGLRLDPERAKRVIRMGALAPRAWSAADRDALCENPTVRGPGVPRKYVFGSDYIYARSHPASAVEGSSFVSPTLALGGFGTAWGAAVLPADPSDIADWPVAPGALEAGYRSVLEWLPLSAGDDALSRAFPLHVPRFERLELAPQALALLDDLQRRAPAGLVFGHARLAVAAKLCRYCGHCLSGCVYGAIFDPGEAMLRHAKAGNVDYRGGWLVTQLAEKNEAVTVTARPLDHGDAAQFEFDRVFLAAGVLNSTRIVLRSFGLFGFPVTVRESHKFALPMIRLAGRPLTWPDMNTLAALFLEQRLDELGGRWMHVQVTPANDFLLQRLAVDSPGWRRSALAPLLRRLMVASCSLHSDYSAEMRAVLAEPKAGAEPVLRVDVTGEDRARGAQRLAARALARSLRPTGTFPITSAAKAFDAGASNHIGGSLPMRAAPSAPNDCDSLGRPGGWTRVHVVDGAVLPSIPATTIALPMMANADRIVSACTFD